MKRYLYNYQTIVSFSQPVTNHHLLLRCQPMTGTYMRIREEHFIISPGYRVNRDVDAFGNRLIYGGQRDDHSALAYVSAGIVEMSSYVVLTPRGISPMYKVPTPLTTLDLEQVEEWNGQGRVSSHWDITEKASAICEYVYGMMTYVPLATNVDTPACDVYQQRRGVCQDYAHLMISLCRLSGISARYVCGFLEGTGETHAWVEVHDGYNWIGFDPTHNTNIQYGYVKIAHGRDASDCPVNRGIYLGNASQQTQINVTLKEI